MEWLKFIIMVVVVGRAIYTDVKFGIIENRNMFLGCMTAFGFAFWYERIAGVVRSGKMLFFVFCILFLVYLVRGLGAGDVKLLCVLAAFVPEAALEVLVASFVVAAFLCVGKMMVRRIQQKVAYIPGETMKFSLPIGIGTVIALLQHYFV